jgi:hypothetical protein
MSRVYQPRSCAASLGRKGFASHVIRGVGLVVTLWVRRQLISARAAGRVHLDLPALGVPLKHRHSARLLGLGRRRARRRVLVHFDGAPILAVLPEVEEVGGKQTTSDQHHPQRDACERNSQRALVGRREGRRRWRRRRRWGAGWRGSRVVGRRRQRWVRVRWVRRQRCLRRRARRARRWARRRPRRRRRRRRRRGQRRGRRVRGDCRHRHVACKCDWQ